jgi:D-tagatose-1,6-bisphosphate aldolase subunit GatZ/KbaZ
VRTENDAVGFAVASQVAGISAGALDVLEPQESLHASRPLSEMVQRQRLGEPVGLTSVCSAHPLVLEAAVLHALESGGCVLVEATSNQVDQTGGYTGMRPPDFRELVHGIAGRCGLPLDRVVLGGDHLGPNRWQNLPAAKAMKHAEVLVAAYVAAGFTKIHLDCSFSCADDPTPITDALAADRAARLIRVAEDTATRDGAVSELRYVIGTEVPVPGGAHETLDGLRPTSAGAARATLRRHRQAVTEQGLGEVWPRIMALVVQPGVEFDHLSVVDYRREGTKDLRQVLEDEPEMVFEAHSTDYQTVEALTALVQDHWAVLKVGPGLTFALREALFALAAIEDELIPTIDRSHLRDVVERRMIAEPGQWEGYYPGGADEQRLARRYSYSDRLRYYWPDPEVHAAQERLLANLEAVDLPLPLVSQYLPDQYSRIRHGELSAHPRDLVIDHVMDVLRVYGRACEPAS